METIVKIWKQIQTDRELLIRKTIQKPRHNNQYTHGLKPKIDNCQLKEQAFYLSTLIPPKMKNITRYIVKCNISLAREPHLEEQLGCLSIHPFSYDYRVQRIDIKDNLYAISLELQDLPQIEFEDFNRMLQTKNSQLSQMFAGYVRHQQNIDRWPCQTKFDFQDMSFQDLPFECCVTKFSPTGVITTQRVFNREYMKMMGVSEVMVTKYIQETGFIPSVLFCDQQDSEYNDYMEMCRAWHQVNKPNRVQLINYQGQRFYANQKMNLVRIRDQVDNCIYEVFFFVYECIPPLMMDNEQVIRNQYQYLGDKSEVESVKAEEEVVPRCGFRLIQ